MLSCDCVVSPTKIDLVARYNPDELPMPQDIPPEGMIADCKLFDGELVPLINVGDQPQSCGMSCSDANQVDGKPFIGYQTEGATCGSLNDSVAMCISPPGSPDCSNVMPNPNNPGAFRECGGAPMVPVAPEPDTGCVNCDKEESP